MVIRRITLVISILLLTLVFLCTGIAFAQNNDHRPITQELIQLVENDPEIGNMLEISIAEARKANPDVKTNPVQTLQDYYDFIDRTSVALPWHILDNPGLSMFDQIDQSLNYFYFLIDQPLPELEGMGLYENSIQYYEPFSRWLKKYLDTWEVFLDSEASWNESMYQAFYQDPEFGLQNDWYEPPSNWKTWNQFFVRRLKSPDVRPIASPDDPSVVVSPADSLPQGVWDIDDESRIRVAGEDGLRIKSTAYYDISDLLGKDSNYKDTFANGVLTHTYLGEGDYHRYHFPVGGTIKEMKMIPQDVAVGGEVTWDPEQTSYIWTPSTGWQFTENRGYVIVDTEQHGPVAVIPVGMSQIASVNFEDDVKLGTTHEKGDMLGYFLFGGSDIVMLFQEEAEVEITAPKEDEITYEHIQTGKEYARMEARSETSIKEYWWIGLAGLLVVFTIAGIVLFRVIRRQKSESL